MRGLVSFFLAGPAAPARLQVLLLGALGVALACLGLLIWGLYWRGEYRDAKAALQVAQAQNDVLAASLTRCDAAAAHTKAVGDAAVRAMGKLVQQAEEAQKGRTASADAIEDLARLARKAGEGCSWAWQQIEQQHRKARGTP